MRVLVVDDSDIAREFMVRTLQAHGHHVQSLPSPIGVTRMIVRDKIDVVVIDVNLPTLSGDRLAALFRKQGTMDKLGVVLVSGIDKGVLKELGDSSEADVVVSKVEITERLHFAVLHAFNARR